MAGHDILLFLSVLLTLALLAEPLATRLHLPFSALLVLLGFLGSEIAVWGGPSSPSPSGWYCSRCSCRRRLCRFCYAD